MTTTDAAPASSAVERHYAFSVLLGALGRMWRASTVVLVVVVVNAALQAVMILGDPVPTASATFALLAAASFAVFLVGYGLLLAGALDAVTGRATLGAAWARLRRRFVPYLLWSVGLLLVVMVGLALYTLPGLLLIAVTPFLLLAVMDGRPNPLVANVRALGARWGRWLVTVVVMGVVAAVLWLLTAVNSFFVTGSVAALISWLVLGFVTAWFTTAWAMVYRSTPVGAPGQEETPAEQVAAA